MTNTTYDGLAALRQLLADLFSDCDGEAPTAQAFGFSVDTDGDAMRHAFEAAQVDDVPTMHYPIFDEPDADDLIDEAADAITYMQDSISEAMRAVGAAFDALLIEDPEQGRDFALMSLAVLVGKAMNGQAEA